MSRINEAWHAAHRMPPRATLDERVSWHVEHARHCGCWPELPGTVVAELKRRGQPVPATRKRPRR